MPRRSTPLPRPKTFMFLGAWLVVRSRDRARYSPHYVNTERDYEGDYQATLPQGRTAADGCKPRHGRGDRKRERSFSGLSKNVHFCTSGGDTALVSRSRARRAARCLGLTVGASLRLTSPPKITVPPFFRNSLKLNLATHTLCKISKGSVR